VPVCSLQVSRWRTTQYLQVINLGAGEAKPFFEEVRFGAFSAAYFMHFFGQSKAKNILHIFPAKLIIIFYI
jgi:hypothetical protein